MRITRSAPREQMGTRGKRIKTVRMRMVLHTWIVLMPSAREKCEQDYALRSSARAGYAAASRFANASAGRSKECSRQRRIIIPLYLSAGEFSRVLLYWFLFFFG